MDNKVVKLVQCLPLVLDDNLTSDKVYKVLSHQHNFYLIVDDRGSKVHKYTFKFRDVTSNKLLRELWL